jgi:hypothetical protein
VLVKSRSWQTLRKGISDVLCRLGARYTCELNASARSKGPLKDVDLRTAIKHSAVRMRHELLSNTAFRAMWEIDDGVN